MNDINRRDLARLLTSGVISAATPISTLAESQSDAGSLSWSPVSPGIWKARFGTPETQTPVSSRLLPAVPAPTSTKDAVDQPDVQVHASVSPRGCELELPLAAFERVYGFGLQLLSMEARGKKRTLRVNADPSFDTGDSHAPVPFYVTSQGYGILIDTARVAEYYVGNARSKPTKPLLAGTTSVSNPQYTHSLEISQAGSILVDVPVAHGVEVYLFAGPTMLDAVRRYNLFSGGGIIPPRWGLGFWYRGDGHSDQQHIEVLADNFRHRKIPCDVLGLEPGWQSHAYSCTYVFDRVRFPEPESLFASLAKKNFKVNLWEHAFTHPSSPIFGDLLPYSGDYGVWGGLVPDFQGEPARRIFGQYHGRYLIDKGVSGFKLDECDASDYTGGWSFPNLSRFPSGIDGEQMHSMFGLRYQHTLYQPFLERKQQTYGLVRSSGALAAPYPFVLYSDLYDQRQFIRGLCTAGFCGLLWCPEVRDAKAPDDLIRRLQSVVFSPLAMVNAWYIKNEPWKQIDRKLNNADQFADDWQDLEARCREIIGWRMQLIPYLRSAFNRYKADGTPPFRALALDYPDEAFASIDDQFMVGDRMMVAPLFYGEASRTVILPSGDWHDFWTGKAISGGTTLAFKADERNIPVFVKAGSVFPLAPVTASTAELESSNVVAHVFGNGALGWSQNNAGTFVVDASSTRGTSEDGLKVVSWLHR